MNHHRPPQLLVGLDAMEWSLVERWAAAGKLPTFRRLIEQGTRATVKSTAEQLPDTIWACVYTGVNPGKFEKYFYVQYDPRTQALRHVLDDEITRPAFWDYLSAAGVRVGVVDAPKFKLSRQLNGFQLANWGAHATKTARAATPANLLNEVNAKFGRHAVGDCDAVDAKPQALDQLRRNVVEGVRQHGELFRWLMRERAWDVFFAGFSAPHCIGHHFWHGADNTHPKYVAAVETGINGAMEEVYCAIDRELGAMIELAGPQTQVLVFAAHGMGPVYHASWNLPEILDTLGYGNKPPRADIAQQPRDAHINPWRILKMTIPGAWQYRIKSMLPQFLQDQLLFLWYSGGRNWAGSRAFAVPNNDAVGTIRLAVKGRDKYGLVAPGAEYSRVRDDIAAALYELTDPVSGRRVVKRVTYVHEEFHGPFVEQLPDLTVLWDQSFPWSFLRSPRLGTLRLRGQDARTGGHSTRGFLLAMGPGVAAGAELTGHSLYDIAPTVLATAGVAAPSDLDGQALRLRSVEVFA
jgi:predicted AlkP superfamily phosphohydrolase/phosphomutase